MSTFGARDLALLLPDNIGEAQNFKTSDQLKAEGDKNYEAPKPKIDASKKTRRYFPGKTPDWIPDENEEITMTVDGSAGAAAAASDSTPPVDRRLARLQQKNENSGRRRQRYEAEVVDDGDDEEEKPRRRGNRYEVVQEGTVLEGDSTLLQELEEQAEEEDENARRARIKAKLLAAAALEEEERAATGRGQSAEDEEGSSEYETDTDSDDSSSEEETDRVMLKPVFIPRSRRETIREKEEKDIKTAALKEQSTLLKEESRKHQTRVLVAESLKRQEEKQSLDAHAATDVDSDGGLPDDDDLTDDDDEEYASWKMRELKRIKGEAERREALVQEKLDIERRRAMTEEERMAEDTKLGKFREKEKKKWKYLQKYYHKGVFYMDDKSTGQVGTSVLASSTGTGAPSSSADYYSPGLQDKQVEDEAARKAAEKKLDARLRDYSGATLEDTYNREKLPEVLQVKKFGMRGRTKYTHLVDQDTTKFGPDSLGKDRNVQSNYLQKRSGVGDIDSAGRRKKKRDNL